jgi:hypothetical protein
LWRILEGVDPDPLAPKDYDAERQHDREYDNAQPEIRFTAPMAANELEHLTGPSYRQFAKNSKR